ncbi:MAG: HEAT repeat domain-containing protein, partial [Gammaproteobacteria bacterium]|nr:HEAT repeat domain-containing protein [Gammaproteobacteria bacterium]
MSIPIRHLWKKLFLLIVLLSPLSLPADDLDSRKRMARSPQTPVSQLPQLATDEEWEVRRAVAANRRSPAELLHTLAQDKDERVRIAVVTNT